MPTCQYMFAYTVAIGTHYCDRRKDNNNDQ